MYMPTSGFSSLSFLFCAPALQHRRVILSWTKERLTSDSQSWIDYIYLGRLVSEVISWGACLL